MSTPFETFQVKYLADRDITATDLSMLPDITPKSTEAAAELQALGGYLIAMILIEHLLEGPRSLAIMGLRTLQSHLKDNRRGPEKLAVNSLLALDHLDSFSATQFQHTDRQALENSLRTLRALKNEATQRFLALQSLTEMPVAESMLRRTYARDLGLSR